MGIRRRNFGTIGMWLFQAGLWVVLRIAERRLLRTLTQPLTLEQRTKLDGLLYADTSIRGATRLS
jgi:hypothetical protein